MIPLKIIVFLALGILIVKLVASILGRDNIPLLNVLVTVILGSFVAFELFKLGQTMLGYSV